MGTRGVGIFSNDLAADVRDEYRSLIERDTDGPAATDEVLRRWGRVVDDDEDGPQFWLALAATQLHLGRLEDRVRSRAVAIIDAGADLERWTEDAPELVARRRNVLADLRKSLLGPQRAPRRPMPRRPAQAKFAPGDIIAYRLDDGRSLLLRVVGQSKDDAGGTAAIMELVDWIGFAIPDEATLARLPARDLEARAEARWRSRTGAYWAPLIIGPSVRGRLSVVGHFDAPPPPTLKTRRFGLFPRTETGWDIPIVTYLRWDAVPDHALPLFGEGQTADEESRESKGSGPS